MKSIKISCKLFKFLIVCIISLYTKLQLIAMDKLRKVWFYRTFSVRLHWCSVMKFECSKQSFLNKFCITAFNVGAWIDKIKYEILTLQNQQAAGEKHKYFLITLIFKIKLEVWWFATWWELRAVLSTQMALLHRTSFGRQM